MRFGFRMQAAGFQQARDVLQGRDLVAEAVARDLREGAGDLSPMAQCRRDGAEAFIHHAEVDEGRQEGRVAADGLGEGIGGTGKVIESAEQHAIVEQHGMGERVARVLVEPVAVQRRGARCLPGIA